MMHIRIFETAHDLNDCVYFADVVEKLVTQSFAGAGAFDQAGDIHELDCRRSDLFRFRDLRDFFETQIWDKDDAEIGINRAERIILSRRFVRPGDSIEQGRFPDVRQSNNSSAEHMKRMKDESTGVEVSSFIPPPSSFFGRAGGI